MKRLIAILWVVGAATCVAMAADAPSGSSSTLVGLRDNGAFGFPQKNARVLSDRPELRFSVWNDDQYLVAQAVLWSYGHESLGKTNSGLVSDWSEVDFDWGVEGKGAPRANRKYKMNSPPGLRGLQYIIWPDKIGMMSTKSDSKGRGAMRCLVTSEGTNVRVDTYLIPLEEIQQHVADTMRICYYAGAPAWRLRVNSVRYEPYDETRRSFEVPLSEHHEYVLTKGSEIDATQFPDDPRAIIPR